MMMLVFLVFVLQQTGWEFFAHEVGRCDIRFLVLQAVSYSVRYGLRGQGGDVFDCASPSSSPAAAVVVVAVVIVAVVILCSMCVHISCVCC